MSRAHRPCVSFPWSSCHSSNKLDHPLGSSPRRHSSPNAELIAILATLEISTSVEPVEICSRTLLRRSGSRRAFADDLVAGCAACRNRVSPIFHERHFPRAARVLAACRVPSFCFRSGTSCFACELGPCALAGRDNQFLMGPRRVFIPRD